MGMMLRYTNDMHRLAFLAAAVFLPPAFAATPFAGRWDLTITGANATYPGWLEVVDQGSTPQVRFQPRAGSVHPVKDARLEGSHLILPVSPASGNRPAMSMDLTADGDKLTGVQKRGDAESGRVTGVRAPELKRPEPKSWTNPEPLFNGKDLTGWEPDNPATNHWVARDGVLVNETKGANLRSTRKFDDFKLHIELNCPQNGNSGIYLRGRYEMQIEYEPAGAEDAYHRMGAIYGMVPTARETPAKAGEWESFDIMLVGRTVTIMRDGVTIIDHQEIAGITGGALDSNEGQPGPFYFQGDHTGGMKFRNITISVPRPGRR